jgi:hypothetical protein
VDLMHSTITNIAAPIAREVEPGKLSSVPDLLPRLRTERLRGQPERCAGRPDRRDRCSERRLAALLAHLVVPTNRTLCVRPETGYFGRRETAGSRRRTSRPVAYRCLVRPARSTVGSRIWGRSGAAVRARTALMITPLP